MKNSKIKIVDIGHKNLNLEDAQSLLETTISQIAYEGNIKVVKVITGHGSGILKNSVREWLKEQEGRFQAVINGEDYNMFNTLASDMRSEWIRRFNKFAKNYFMDDTSETANCLKDVFLLHKWTKIQQNLTPIDFVSQLDEKRFTEIDTMGAVACQGGECEITF